MAEKRKLSVMSCTSCGKNHVQVGGASNWVMCDKCFQIHCPSCYRKKLKQSTHCTQHQPWGKWMRSKVSGSEAVFK